MVRHVNEKSMRRYFIEFQPNEMIRIEGEQFVHMAFVLRSKIGERVIISRNDDFDYIYEIIKIDKNHAELKYIDKKLNKCNPKINLSLMVALEKGDKLDLVVQKAVELGVSNIFPIKTEYCQIKANYVKIDRLQKIANEACKQCGRSKTTIIHEVINLSDLPLDNSNSIINCFLYEGNCEINLIDYLNNFDRTKINKINLIIGPEGGFAEKEVQFLQQKGLTPLTLGNRILRAETACIAVCSIVMAFMGELQ